MFEEVRRVLNKHASDASGIAVCGASEEEGCESSSIVQRSRYVAISWETELTGDYKGV